MERLFANQYVSTAFALFLAGTLVSHSEDTGARLVPVGRSQLCVTKGAVKEKSGSQLAVAVPEMPAVVAYATCPVAEAKFTYLGPTKKDRPLRSGVLRRQFGLKLLAQNGCNLVYAMWRIEPKQELVVSVKLNSGQTTNAECGTNGYTPSSLLVTSTCLTWLPGNSIRCAQRSRETRCGYTDGPSGVRTDNGRFNFEFLSSQPVSGHKNPPCHAASGDE